MSSSTAEKRLASAQLAADRRAKIMIAELSVVFIIFVCLSLSLGRFSIPFEQVFRILLSRIVHVEVTWTEQMENILLNVRLPRVIAAILVGAALSLSGAAYQAMFRNPLVSPDILGVSSGACVGAAFGILMHAGGFGVEICALVCGIASVVLAIWITRLFKNSGKLMLVLAGVLVSGFMSSVLSFLKYVADPDSELAEIVYWIMGSLASARWQDIKIVAPVITVAVLLLLALRWRINLLSLGEEDAKSLGMNVKLTKALIVICATLLTSTSVCISGSIGWVGLVIPHMCRLIIGQDNKNLLPAAVSTGAVFLLIVDTICRNLTASEIPLSIFTGLIGVPVFLWLLLMQNTRVDE